MPDDPPTRPWHRRKRAWAAALLWLIVAYPVSEGPACYAARRRWINSDNTNFRLYAPMLRNVPDEWFDAYHRRDYVMWWVNLAGRHEADGDAAVCDWPTLGNTRPPSFCRQAERQGSLWNQGRQD